MEKQERSWLLQQTLSFLKNKYCVNEIFCCDILGIYQLAFEVIRTNFGGFFEKLGNLSGSVTEKVAPLMKKAAPTDTAVSI